MKRLLRLDRPAARGGGADKAAPPLCKLYRRGSRVRLSPGLKKSERTNRPARCGRFALPSPLPRLRLERLAARGGRAGNTGAATLRGRHRPSLAVRLV